MRKAGILNADLAYAINRLGHMDTFAVADCGLPLPDHVEVIDLSLVFGIPHFEEVVTALLDEVVVQETTIADQTPDSVISMLGSAPIARISHEELKTRINDVKFVVRTGETIPYANVIFTSGVAF